MDGTPWGLETIEDLWDSYQENYEAALQAQVERQQEAIAKLQDLEAVMRSWWSTSLRRIPGFKTPRRSG
ncbi:MAG: hypothetical protein ACFCU2_05525 [Acidimicrobiia bacterium]